MADVKAGDLVYVVARVTSVDKDGSWVNVKFPMPDGPKPGTVDKPRGTVMQRIRAERTGAPMSRGLQVHPDAIFPETT